MPKRKKVCTSSLSWNDVHLSKATCRSATTERQNASSSTPQEGLAASITCTHHTANTMCDLLQAKREEVDDADDSDATFSTFDEEEVEDDDEEDDDTRKVCENVVERDCVHLLSQSGTMR